jgi:hypothetical protein
MVYTMQIMILAALLFGSVAYSGEKVQVDET